MLLGCATTTHTLLEHRRVFNGDQVTGENLLAHNATSALTLALVPVLHKRIPFASIYGNHDQSVNISHTQLYNHEKKLARWTGLSHTGVNPSSAEEIDGAYNYVLPVRANLRSDKLEFILWFFDSRSGIFDDPARYEDWVDPLAATVHRLWSKFLFLLLTHSNLVVKLYRFSPPQATPPHSTPSLSHLRPHPPSLGSQNPITSRLSQRILSWTQ